MNPQDFIVDLIEWSWYQKSGARHDLHRISDRDIENHVKVKHGIIRPPSLPSKRLILAKELLPK